MRRGDLLLRRESLHRLLGALIATLALAALAATPASADFGLSEMSVRFLEEDGLTEERQAGSHPFQMKTSFRVNTTEHPEKGIQVIDGAIKDLDIVFPAGFVGNPAAVPSCETIDFLSGDCSDATALGILAVEFAGGLGESGKETVPVYNLPPSPGSAAKLGFEIAELLQTVEVIPGQTAPYNVTARLRNTPQITEVIGAETTLWGNPADPIHDSQRGKCQRTDAADLCPAKIPVKPFLTLPRSCGHPLITTFKAISWWSGSPLDPGPSVSFEGTAQTPALTGCSKLRFGPTLSAQPTTTRADSASGLAVDVAVEDPGLANPDGSARSDIKKAVLTLPEGMTANPSLAEGLTTCSLTDLARETLNSAPGEGCPAASKIGAIEAETPILEGAVIHGSLYIAAQDDPTAPGPENPFNSLLAFYVVLKHPELGVIVKQAAKIEPHPLSGQLVSTLEDLPPFPLSEVRLRLREGGRSPLVTPSICGTYTSRADLFPSGDPSTPFPIPTSFQITQGVGGAPCPPAGAPPFAPGFQAGSLNNNAGSFSPFHMRITRRDGDQDLTRFDAKLPKGTAAILAGVSQCPDAAIAAAKAKRGRAELASPSCPPNSQIGIAKGGAGVGDELTYASGKLYLAGPFAGAPLSVLGIVPAVAGPFDVGTVVVRQALEVDPKTGEVEVDGAKSDPIPHILAGIPLRVRDIRVDVDRDRFTFNPTSCNRFATVAQIWGGGTQLFSTLDDSPVTRRARFQAANCARLGFKPRISLALKGGTARGAHPALRGVLRARPGDANLSDIVARLPRSAFLDQAHIRTICTRVQFAADNCPKGAIYGTATVFTPILEDPLKGPVYLRSSSNDLPDMVLDLHGLVDIEVSARIDSVKGGIRASFEDAPDAPLSRAILSMQGGKKGLIVNSRNLCSGTNRARIELEAQSGKQRKLSPVLRAKGCGKR
jgi:predicted RNA binding protein YcfA (HicA-like mRNA interferase family)